MAERTPHIPTHIQSDYGIPKGGSAYRPSDYRSPDRKNINPFSSRIFDFPGRIFPFDSPLDEEKEIQALASAAPKRIVEIGSGSGEHLIELAARNPQALCLGFELRFKRAVRTLEKASKRGLNNIFVARRNGEHLMQCFPENSVDELYVNFPDPWNKMKHRKFRLLNPNFLSLLNQILAPKGFFSFKTDSLDYFLSTAELIKSDARFVINEYSTDLHQSEYSGGNILTEFEKLFISQGLSICYLKARFRG